MQNVHRQFHIHIGNTCIGSFTFTLAEFAQALQSPRLKQITAKFNTKTECWFKTKMIQKFLFRDTEFIEDVGLQIMCLPGSPVDNALSIIPPPENINPSHMSCTVLGYKHLENLEHVKVVSGCTKVSKIGCQNRKNTKLQQQYNRQPIHTCQSTNSTRSDKEISI